MRIVLSIAAAIVLVFAGSFLFAFLGSIPRERRLRRMAASRNAHEAAVRCDAALHDVPERVRAMGLGMIRNAGLPDGFPLWPEDHLLEDLDLDQGNVENELDSYARQRDLEWTDFDGPLATVEDFVRFVGLLSGEGVTASAWERT